MPISGLILTLEEDPRSQAHGLAWLRGQPELEVGVQEGRRLAVVSDTASPEADKVLWAAMQQCAGVQHVDVVYIHFDDPAAAGDDADAGENADAPTTEEGRWT